VSTRLPAGIAAGHPETAAAGLEILDAGGSAVDAAVAACLASCVAETVMTGLLGGGHAIVYDAASGRVRNLDCFCAVPGLGAEQGRSAELVELAVPFGAELVHYAVGPASCAVPGVPAGLGVLWREFGVLTWARLVEPALRLARDGVEMPPTHAACLEMLAPVLTLDLGAGIYAPGGRLLRAGDRLEQPGLVHALESLGAEGPEGAYSGTIAQALLRLAAERGALLTEADLAAYEAVWAEPVEVPRLGSRWVTRRGISLVPETLAVLPDLGGFHPTDRLLALVEALDGAGGTAPAQIGQHTTNVTTVDGTGNACVFTTSLGLGSGDYVLGLDLHLNSMLGEVDLVAGGLPPSGERVPSMMAPTFVLDEDGLSLAVGAAGGTRLRTALLTAATSVLDEGLEPQEAVDRPRVHPDGAVVNAEPGADDEGLAALEASGRTARRWPDQHHYFGGVSLIARRGGAGDPRRSGAALAAR
jgi:gamma-glutamyltranspeptidase/glutathione hydrolase